MHGSLARIGTPASMMLALIACGPGRVGDSLDEVGSEVTSDSGESESQTETESETESETQTETETQSETETETGESLCDEVHTQLTVTADTLPESLVCVRDVGLLIIENTALTDLSVFPALESVDNLAIQDNPQMSSLGGADALESVGLLSLRDVPMLGSLAGFTPDGIESLYLGSGLDGLVSLDLDPNVNVDELILYYWDRADASPVADLQPNVDEQAYFTVRLWGTSALVDLSAIATCCGGANLELIAYGPGQINFLGLESQTVMGKLELRGSSIESFAGLENLEQLDELLIAWDCPNGSHNTLTSLDGLSSLAQVERIVIEKNPNLLTLAGLDALTLVDELTVFDNNALAELAFPPGLAVAAVAEIRDNDALPEADVDAFLASIGAAYEASCGNGQPNDCTRPAGPCPQ